MHNDAVLELAPKRLARIMHEGMSETYPLGPLASSRQRESRLEAGGPRKRDLPE
jgi:hypothetical protein